MKETKINVLVADDSKVARMVLVQVLEADRRLRVMGTVNDGQAALDFLRDQKPDVIVMDLHMPGLDGFEATRRIMETNPVPIVICTATMNARDVAISFRAMEAGAVACVEKPVSTDHPAYEALGNLGATYDPPYAWYVRVPDLPRFVRHIAPQLERRLADSVAAGHTGELKLNFYRYGVRLKFEQGRLESVDTWQPSSEDESNPSFPNLTFLQLLFGYRSLDELRQAYVDVQYGNDTARVLLNALFPRQASHVWALT